MPTHNQIDLVEFPAASPQQVAATTAFFGAVFGWTYTQSGDEYSDSQDSGITNGVNGSTPGEKSRLPLAVVYVQDLESARASVLAAGGTVAADIYSFPGGRRFHFTEPAGSELAVWSDR